MVWEREDKTLVDLEFISPLENFPFKAYVKEINTFIF